MGLTNPISTQVALAVSNQYRGTVYTTHRKINMEPENTPLEIPGKENHLPNLHFQVLC